ncbi:MAG: SprT-like domain-containing protein [Weeksellaceae bacterium]|nr:SprT-like domain-containing protein [Weeksellaceae bacterium]
MHLKNHDILLKYTPPGSLEFIEKWTENRKLKLIIKWERKNILGNYCYKRNYHQITLNNNLTKELFFLTLTHELAHMHVQESFKKKVKPHGPEWKNIFGELMMESIGVYSENLQPIIQDFAENPKANFFSYSPMVEYFFDDMYPNKLILKSLPEKSFFLYNQKLFQKGKMRKLKYLCQEVSTGREYLFHVLAPIDVAEH